MNGRTAFAQVAVSGELTIFTAAEVRERLLAALDAADEVDVDLGEVAEFDSAGLQLMIAAKREAARRDKKLRFSRHSAAVLDILDLTELSAHLGDPVLLPSDR